MSTVPLTTEVMRSSGVTGTHFTLTDDWAGRASLLIRGGDPLAEVHTAVPALASSRDRRTKMARMTRR
jgi:hypothetical protein